LAGLSVADAAASVGASETAGFAWIAESGGMIPVDLQECRSGRYLNEAEREELAVGWAAGLSPAEIARGLGRHPSTIGRELSRNRTVRRPAPVVGPDGQRPRRGPVPGTNRGRDRPQHERLRYRAVVAQSKADERARRPKAGKLARNPDLRAVVSAGLTRRWSPEQISRTLRRDYPDQPEMQVSHETIYQALYVQGRGELRRELARCLRTGRALRRPRRLPDRRSQRPHIPEQLLIAARPAEVEDRAVPGHWEGDLIIGAGGVSAIGTLVERSTRFVLLLHLPGRHTAEAVRDAMIAQIATLPAALRRSLTWDQGIELARHGEITIALDLPIFFCDPHSPWQRGSNENTNGLLRQYFPKGSDLSVHSAEHLAAVADELNARPRKTLGWDSPAQQLARLLAHPDLPAH
jgi:IS30 family transposase